MNLSQKSGKEKDDYMKDMNSSLVTRIIQIRQEIIDLLMFLDNIEGSVSKNQMFRETK